MSITTLVLIGMMLFINVILFVTMAVGSANRIKTILLLFSPNNSESYWIDKAEQVLENFITLCRIYNNNYVTFEEKVRMRFIKMEATTMEGDNAKIDMKEIGVTVITD